MLSSIFHCIQIVFILVENFGSLFTRVTIASNVQTHRVQKTNSTFLYNNYRMDYTIDESVLFDIIYFYAILFSNEWAIEAHIVSDNYALFRFAFEWIVWLERNQIGQLKRFQIHEIVVYQAFAAPWVPSVVGQCHSKNWAILVENECFDVEHEHLIGWIGDLGYLARFVIISSNSMLKLFHWIKKQGQNWKKIFRKTTLSNPA
jgi:hypothetical protein